MSREKLKELRKYWWAVVFLILAVSGISSWWLEGVTIPNPNSNLRGRNDPTLIDSTDDGLRFFLSGMSDTLDSDDFGNVEYWTNRSILGNQTFGYILYYNGDNSDYYNESIPLSNYNNEKFWWTGYHFFDPIIFDPFDSTNRTTYIIPKQEAGKEIIYQLRLQDWNGSQWLYEKFNMTYVVLYSEGEVQFERSLQRTVYTYIRIDLIVIFFALVIMQPWKAETSRPPQPATSGRLYKLSVSNLIARAGHLEGQLNGVRTGASILLTLGISMFSFVMSSILLDNSVRNLSMIMGPFALAILCFIGIIQSLSSLEVHEGGYSLGSSLIPDDMSEYMYKKILPKAVDRRDEVLSKTLVTIKMGIVYFFSFMLAGVINLILPNVQYYLHRIELAVPYYASFILTVVTAFLFVMLIAERKKILEQDF